MGKPKVFGFHTTAGPGWEVPAGRHIRVVVAAPSRKAVVGIAKAAGLNVTIGYLATYASLTGNDKEIAVATACSGRIHYSADGGAGPFYVAPIKEDVTSGLAESPQHRDDLTEVSPYRDRLNHEMDVLARTSFQSLGAFFERGVVVNKNVVEPAVAFVEAVDRVRAAHVAALGYAGNPTQEIVQSLQSAALDLQTAVVALTRPEVS